MGFKEIWPQIREKFPPARAVAFLTPIILPLIAVFNGWLIDHLPFVAEQVGPTEVTAFVLGTLGGGIALAYKWLDGRAKWEQAQVATHLALVQQGLTPAALPPGVLEPPPAPADTDLTPDATDPDYTKGLDEDAYFSHGEDDIAESDVEDPDALVKRERDELDSPQ